MEPSQIMMDDGITNQPQRYTPKAKAVLVSSCGFPDPENFNLMSLHFKKFMKHIGVTWAGSVLIPAAGASGVPHLLDSNFVAVRQAGAELVKGQYHLKQCMISVMLQLRKKTIGTWLMPALKVG